MILTPDLLARINALLARVPEGTTEAPWTADVSASDDVVVWGPKKPDGDDNFIANVCEDAVTVVGVARDADAANASLIALAPDMLALLREVVKEPPSVVARVWYLGIWPGTGGGHFEHNEFGTHIRWPVQPLIEGPEDDRFGPHEVRDSVRQGQGLGRLVHYRIGGSVRFSSIAFYANIDKDMRGNCSCTFLVEGAHTWSEAEIAARKAFPSVWAAIDARKIEARPFFSTASVDARQVA